MRYFLGMLAALALVAGATKVGYDRFEEEIETRSGPATTQPTGTTLPPILPGTGQVVVVGLIANAHIESGLIDPIPVPLTVTTTERGGESGATLSGVLVDGADASIHWDAGTPLKLGGTGSLALGAVTIDVEQASTTVTFGAAPHGITPGSYEIQSPVAVSTGGALAEPHDTVAFTATASSTIAFSGPTSTAIPTRAITVKGPGKVVLNGSLTVVQPDKSQARFSAVSLDSGPFTITFSPTDKGLTVQATLQGAVTTKA